MGFSQFELLYGRRVSKPLDLLRAHWEGGVGAEKTSVVGCVLALQVWLKEATDIMHAQYQAPTNQDLNLNLNLNPP